MFAVLDFETSGLDAKARATEIGIVLLNRHLEIEATFHSVLNPPVAVNKYSLGYARLQRREIETAPRFADLWPQISALLNGRIIVAHGAEFDIGILNRELEDLNLVLDFPAICTLKLIRRLNRPGTESNELPQVCARLGIPLVNPHEALQDAVATAALFRQVVNGSKSEDSRGTSENSLEFKIDELADKVLVLPPLETSASPQPRIPAASGDSLPNELASLAQELLSNVKVRSSRFVVKTGILERGESQLEIELERVGLRLKETPTTEGTAFLVVGSRPGKAKAERARHYGRPVLSEEDAYALIDVLEVLGGF